MAELSLIKGDILWKQHFSWDLESTPTTLNERVSFGALSYVGRGHSWILPPTSRFCGQGDEELRRGKLCGSPVAKLREYNPFLCRTAAEALAAVRRRRHGGEGDCTPGAEPSKPPGRRWSFGGSLAAPAVYSGSWTAAEAFRLLGARRQIRQLSSWSKIPFSSMSRFMDFRESRPKFLSPNSCQPYSTGGTGGTNFLFGSTLTNLFAPILFFSSHLKSNVKCFYCIVGFFYSHSLDIFFQLTIYLLFSFYNKKSLPKNNDNLFPTVRQNSVYIAYSRSITSSSDPYHPSYYAQNKT